MLKPISKPGRLSSSAPCRDPRGSRREDLQLSRSRPAAPPRRVPRWRPAWTRSGTWPGRWQPHKERRRRRPGRAAESSPDHAGSNVVRRRFTPSAGRAGAAGPGKSPIGMRRRTAFPLQVSWARQADLPGVSKQRPRGRPHFLSPRPRRRCRGRVRPRAGRPSRSPRRRRRASRIPAPLRERKRLNEELRGGSGAPGEEAAGWEQTLASREPRPARRGREGGGGGARGALTCPFLSFSLRKAGKHERADPPLRRPPRLLASASAGRPSPVRGENARREDGGRAEEPPGLQLLCAPERWAESGTRESWWGSGVGGRWPCFVCVWGEGREGKRRKGGPGARRGLVVGKEGEGPGAGAVRSARPRCSPRLGCRTFSGHRGAPAGLLGGGNPCNPARSAWLRVGASVSFCLESSGREKGLCMYFGFGSIGAQDALRWVSSRGAPTFP